MSLDLKTSILKVSKQLLINQMSKESVEFINEIDNMIAKKIIKTAEKLITSSNHVTINPKAIQSAVRLILPTELARKTMSDGMRAMSKYIQSQTPGDRSKRAGLQVQVSRIENYMREILKTDIRINEYAPVYLAGVIEYLNAHILDISKHDAGDKRIDIKYVKIGLYNDDEFSKLLLCLN
jgi:histone H3/H4